MKIDLLSAAPAVAKYALPQTSRSNIQLNDIAMFVEVARRRNFSLSAAALGIRTSTLSRRMNELERDLGVQLLKRSTRRIDLTEAGWFYFERCRNLVDEARVAHEQIQCCALHPGGRLSVSLPSSLAQLFLSSIMQDFREAYPKIQCQFELGNQAVDPISSTYDVALRFGAQPSSSLITRSITEMTPRLYASSAYLARHLPPTTPAALLGHQCLVQATTGTCEWRLQCGMLVESVRVSGTVATNDSGMIRSLICDGLGIGSLLDFEAIAAEGAGDKIEPVLPGWSLPAVPLIALSPTRALPKRVQVFLEFVEHHLKAR